MGISFRAEFGLGYKIQREDVDDIERKLPLDIKIIQWNDGDMDSPSEYALVINPKKYKQGSFESSAAALAIFGRKYLIHFIIQNNINVISEFSLLGGLYAY